MSLQTQADLLIKTLAELRDAACECEAARLRLQCRTHAQQFVQAFRPELVEGERPSDWIPEFDQTAQRAMSPAQND